MRGKIDASVRVRIDEVAEPVGPLRGQAVFPPKTTITTMPLEIKTGRSIGGMEHRAQTMLYS